MYLIRNIIFASITAATLTGCLGPSEYDPALTATPSDMFIEGCQSCHGEKGEGKFGMILKLAGTEATISDIANKMENGGQIMPAFPGVETPQRMILAAYVKTL